MSNKKKTDESDLTKGYMGVFEYNINLRDPERIDRIMSLIKKVWKHYPDLRLTQLIMNVLKFQGDPYHIEDIDLEEALKEYCRDRRI